MRVRHLLIAVWLLVLAVTAPAQEKALGRSERIADGVELYRLDDPELVSPTGPVSVQALRIDPRLMTLEVARAQGDTARETVAALAEKRPGTIAAINGGFFSVQTGRPTDLLKVAGRVLRGTKRPRGAVGILERGGVTTLLFDRVRVIVDDDVPEYRTMLGTSPDDWAQAPHAISGAGLLLLNGQELKDWPIEVIGPDFADVRHPRTMIGTDPQGAIWLITVDGRNPLVSLGMTFDDLRRLAKRLRLHSALNLDGGGSTTMWIDGKIVNHPSDRNGPRKMSDAILVIPRLPKS